MASDIRNIGPKSRAWLAEIDIHSIADLHTLGAVEAYARLRFHFGKAISRNMLHALAGALSDIDWRQLSPEHKAELNRQADERLARFNITDV
jgi:DNA transformation protein and related proteins